MSNICNSIHFHWMQTENIFDSPLLDPHITRRVILSLIQCPPNQLSFRGLPTAVPLLKGGAWSGGPCPSFLSWMFWKSRGTTIADLGQQVESTTAPHDMWHTPTTNQLRQSPTESMRLSKKARREGRQEPQVLRQNEKQQLPQMDWTRRQSQRRKFRQGMLTPWHAPNGLLECRRKSWTLHLHLFLASIFKFFSVCSIMNTAEYWGQCGTVGSTATWGAGITYQRGD